MSIRHTIFGKGGYKSASGFPGEPYLVGAYKMDETSGTTMFNSVSGFSGTLANVTINQTGKIDKAYSFNGTSSRVEMTDNNDFSFIDFNNPDLPNVPFSIAMWVNFDVVGDMMLVSKIGASSGREWYIYNNNGTLRFTVFSGTGTSNYIQRNATPNFQVSTWYHLVVTYNSSGTPDGMKIYINGVEASSTGVTSGSFVKTLDSSTFPVWGRHGGVNALWFKGLMDENYFWKNYALTPENVTTLYNGGNGLTLPVQ